ncbi:MAG: RnfABCDGE type electron transport complex subunit G [Methanomethylovorans sp.]|nr:RnfABCDGE type electron transport complex subunit G [Methanomethylovorans sp.]
MTDNNRDFIVIVGKLVLIAAVAATLLGITYVPTQEQLKENIAKAREQKLLEVMPQAATFDPVYGDTIINEDGDKEILYYLAKDGSGNLVGYAFFKRQPGSQNIIEVAGGVNSDFTQITGMSVLSHSETPGLGARIIEPAFRQQFNGIPLSQLKLSSSGGSIDSITGATISSQAVIDAMSSKVDSIKRTEG